VGERLKTFASGRFRRSYATVWIIHKYRDLLQLTITQSKLGAECIHAREEIEMKSTNEQYE